MNTNVFISYAKPDLEKALRLYNDLKRAGIAPWLDEKDLLPGQKRDLVIRQQIRKNRFFLGLMSEAAVKPGEVIRQINWALDVSEKYPEDDIHVIPVILEDCELPHEKLRELTKVDMSRGWDDGVQKIIRVVQGSAEAETEPGSSEARGPDTGNDSPDLTSKNPVKNRWALLVGVNRYVDPSFAPLKFCVNDVIALAKAHSSISFDPTQ